MPIARYNVLSWLFQLIWNSHIYQLWKMFKNKSIFFSSDVPVWILLRLGLLFDLKHAGFGLKKQAPTKSTHVKSTELYCRWQNGKQYKGKANSQQSALARRVRQGCTGQPPPSLHWVHSHIGWLRNSIVKISLNTKLWQNYFEYREIGGKLRKTWN